MRHDPRLALPEAHQGWCECRACAPRRQAGAELREGLQCAIAGAAAAAPVAAALTIIHYWPAITAWAAAL